jgi:hypothetical protein
MIYYLTLRPSEEFAWDYVNKGLAGGGPPAEVLCYEDVLGKAEVPAGVYVFTGLNRFGPGARKALGQLYDQLGADPATRPLNDPNQALGRFELLRRLHQEGMNGFRAFGAWEDLSELRFPVFVRDRSRDGGIPTLLHSIREVEAEVGWALVRGAALSELIIVEFLDTRCEDGLYRKYSAYVVGDEILPVSLEHGRDWVLRYPRAEFTPEGLAEERRFVLEGSHQDQLEKIRLISRIQFGRMDFSVYEGKVQTWEINTLPTMRLPPGEAPMAEHLQALRREKNEHFKARFGAAWQELGKEVGSARAVRLGLSDEVVRDGLNELAMEVPTTFPQPGKHGFIKSLFRPFKPVVMPLATRTVIPIVGKRNMRRALQASSTGSGH